MKHLLAFLVFLTFLPFFSIAEEQEGEVEKIDVIGSHIKRTNIEGPAPVLVIDRDQIEMSGYNSLSDVLRDLPVASGGAKSEQSLGSPASRTKTTLRGMSQSDILVLINGRRMSAYGGESAVDLTMIPLSVIEKVEILKDGASALYGSDAVGGVINVVTKKNQVGGQVNVQGSLVQREEGNAGIASFVDFWNWNDTGPSANDNSWSGKGDKLSIDVSYGGNENDINYLIGGQVRFNSPLYLRDRSFGRLGEAKDGSPYGSPGSWSDDGGKTWNAAPDCPESHKQSDNKCGFDWSPYMQFMPQILQSTAFAQANTLVMDDVNISGLVLYTHTRTHSIIAPAPDDFDDDTPGGKDYRIPVETAQKWGLNPKGPVTVLYRLVEEEGSGNRETVLNTHSYQTQFSLAKPLKDTMEIEGHLSLSGSYYSRVSANYMNKEILFNMANEETFNPFKPSGQKDDISEAGYNPTQDTFSNLISVEPQLSGELTEISGQPLMFAVGALGAWQYYLQENDTITSAGKQWGGNVAVDGGGDRLYSSVYGELSTLLFEMAELQLAARSDAYSDFGWAWQDVDIPFTTIPLPFSPRVAFSLQPVDLVKLRASWGMGFKAPSLSSLYRNETIHYPSSRDLALCDDAYYNQGANKDTKQCKDGTQYKTFKRSNKNLKPEFSESFNVGIVLEPVERFSLSMDYYRNNQRDIAGTPSLRDIFKYEKKHGVEELRKLGLDVVRGPGPEGTVDHVVTVPANLAQYKVHGVDLEMNLIGNLREGWDLGLNFEHSHILYSERQALKGGDIENPVPFYQFFVDWFGVENADSKRKNDIPWDEAPRWRNRATVSLINKDRGHQFDLVVHNIPSRLQTRELQTKEAKKLSAEEMRKEAKNNDVGDGFIDYYWQLDLRGSFRLDKNSRLIVGVQNILGFDRPTRDRENGFYAAHEIAGIYLNSNFYSLRGRSIDVRFTYDF